MRQLIFDGDQTMWHLKRIQNRLGTKHTIRGVYVVVVIVVSVIVVSVIVQGRQLSIELVGGCVRAVVATALVVIVVVARVVVVQVDG